jgi:hypothetical protein
MRMRIFAVCLIIAALGDFCWGAEKQKNIEKQLRGKIEGGIYRLLKPYVADNLEFESGGRISGASETGSPAVNGFLQITSLSLNKQALRVAGWRVVAALPPGPNERFVMVVTDLPIHIAIHLAQPISDELDGQAAWARVFSVGDPNEGLAGFWKPFAEDKGDGKTTQHNDTDGVIGLLNDRPVYPSVSELVTQPQFRKSHRAEHHSSPELIGGHASIRMIIDEGGRPALMIADNPADPLQSDAIASASRLSFTPATKDGTPVSVLMLFETDHRIH